MKDRSLTIRTCLVVVYLMATISLLINDSALAQSQEDIDQARARCDPAALGLSNFAGVGTTAYFDRLAISLFLRQDRPMDPGVAGVLDCYKPITVVVSFTGGFEFLKAQASALQPGLEEMPETPAADDPIIRIEASDIGLENGGSARLVEDTAICHPFKEVRQ